MDVFDTPAVDVRPLLPVERGELLDLLLTLSPPEWRAETAAPGWSVKDVALHLLDDDLGLLSRGRDGDTAGLVDVTDHDSLVRAIADKNQRWIDGSRSLSPSVIIGLLSWAGQELDAYYSNIDFEGYGHVSWASDEPVPIWIDIARELTERWVHQMQIREAVDRVDRYAAVYLPTVLRTFVWAIPHQYRVDAALGATVLINLASGGTWYLTCNGSGRWRLEEGSVDNPDARADFSDGCGWRWLTGAELPAQGLALQGPPHLCEPLLNVRAIIA